MRGLSLGISLIGLLGLTACQQSLPFGSEQQSSLLVQAQVGPDSLAKIYITQSNHFNRWREQEPDTIYVEGLSPFIFASGERFALEGGPDSFGRYCYRANKLLPDSGEYRLEVLYRGDTLSANVKVPPPPITAGIRYEFVEVIQEFTNQRIEQIRIYFQDHLDREDAYRFTYGYSARYEIIAYDSALQVEYLDTVRYNNKRTYLPIDDTVPNGTSLYFDINPFSNLIPEWEILPDGSQRPYQLIWISLSAVSLDIYKFERSIYEYFLTATDDPFVEPIFLHSNIQNGRGIFGAYHNADTVWQKIYLD